MSQNREEILANFQECTGIDNVGEAIMWLENANWDLLTAINNAVPQEDQMQFYKTTENKNENFDTPVTVSSDFIKLPSTSDAGRVLDFQVHFQFKTYKLQVPESMTVSCVKTLIYSECKVPPCQQEITGWASNKRPSRISDDTPLKKLCLSDTTNLYLKKKGSSTNDLVMEIDVEAALEAEIRQQSKSRPEAGDHLSRPSGSRGKRSGKVKDRGDDLDGLIHLKVHDGNKNKEHNVSVAGTQKVLDIKKDIANLTGIALPKQTWLGWPDNATDSMELSELNLDQPVHHLTVVELQDSPITRKKTKRSSVRYSPSSEMSDSGAETDSFVDVSESFSGEDEIFTEEPTTRNRIAPLMPDNIDDETVGSVSFIDGYTLRYGQTSPNFFSGSLENAMNEAFLKTGRDKKMLAVYLHHDGSILTNVFCSQLLGSESILQLFATYFVVWGWDVTNRRNRDMLLNSVMKHLGQNISQEIMSVKSDDYPALLILSKFNSNIQLLNLIRGNIGANELLNMLVNTIDIFSERLESVIQTEEERAARDKIKFEQDMAYQESLILDKAKEESKRQQLLLETQEAERQKQEELTRMAEKLDVESRLPIEPDENPANKEIMTFRFRTPTGDFFIRRFWVNDQLQTVFDYLLVKGFRVDQFKVISPWPRKDLSALEGTSLLMDAGLCPQETLTLEER